MSDNRGQTEPGRAELAAELRRQVKVRPEDEVEGQYPVEISQRLALRIADLLEAGGA